MNPDQRIQATLRQHPMDLPGVVRVAKPETTWAQLRQTNDTLPALKAICSEFKPGKSLVCLFAGAPGASRTLAAQAIAKQLGLAMVRVDLSVVASPYRGETEKNLQRVFDSASAPDTLLFFDEADALLGKRSEVKDSHDRYANLEADALLQRLQTYGGLSILAICKKQAIDGVLLRRLHHVIDFPA